MPEAPRIFRNTSAILASNIVVKVLSAVMLIVLMRYFGTAGFGSFSFAFAFAAMFIIISDFGLDALVIRDVARDKALAGAYLDSVGKLRILLSLSMILATLGASFFIGLDAYSISVVLLAGIGYFFDKLAGLAFAVFRAHERMELEAITQVIWKVSQFGAVLLAVFLGYWLREIVLVFLILAVIRCIIGYTGVLAIGVVPDAGKLERKTLLRAAAPFAAYEIAYAVYLNIIVVMLFLIAGDVQAGIFSAAHRFIIWLIIIPSAFETAIYPVFARLYSSSPLKMKLAYAKSMKFTLITSIPLAFCMILLPDLYTNILGASYIDTGFALGIMAFAFPVLSLNLIMKTALWSSNRPVLVARNIILSTITLGIIAYLLILRYDYAGAAAAFLAAEILLFCLNYTGLRKHLTRIGRHLWKPVVGGCAMSSVVYAGIILSDGTLGPVQVTLLAIGAYIAVLLALKTITPVDREIFSGAFRREPRTP